MLGCGVGPDRNGVGHDTRIRRTVLQLNGLHRPHVERGLAGHAAPGHEELFLSPHTVKSQAKSVYRKLGGSSRSQVVTQARKAGLLEG